MSFNPHSKGVESKLYFIIFFLFASFLTVLIYNLAIDVAVDSDLASSRGAGIFNPRIDAGDEN